MSLFVIADLHLSSDGAKSMEVFGARWFDYMNRLKVNWNRVVTPDDTVVIPGDISWGLKPEDAVADLKFLDALNGQKLIGKGNHDFWWSTATKFCSLMNANDIQSIKMLYNNAVLREGAVLCGTRGWFVEEKQQNTVGEVNYARIVNREVIRLRISLDAAKALQDEHPEAPLLVFLHFPPVWGDFVCREILDVLHEYGVKDCYFGHLHGVYHQPRSFVFEEIRFSLIAADALDFTPFPIFTPKSKEN